MLEISTAGSSSILFLVTILILLIYTDRLMIALSVAILTILVATLAECRFLRHVWQLFVHDGLRSLLEYLCNINADFRGSFEELKAVLIGKRLASLRLYCFIWSVALIRD